MVIVKVTEGESTHYYRASDKAALHAVFSRHCETTEGEKGARVDYGTIEGIEAMAITHGLDYARRSELPPAAQDLLTEAETVVDIDPSSAEFLVRLAAMTKGAPPAHVESDVILPTGSLIRSLGPYQSQLLRRRNGVLDRGIALVSVWR